MKLLRDFIRLRTAGRSLPRIRRGASRRVWTVTVPAPLAQSPAQAAAIDMHWHADRAVGRPVAHWHDRAVPQAHGHQPCLPTGRD
ncbi:hypothetical protein ASG87_10860 [Frateuria sp. Soil773]|uniref:hypothetical protein n=1 Tax=Frateuria sp. Soil773 TaxID=1736407 RepID=UPI0006F2FD67|nr:hypothetical protein [Frateuria sp. Soil773]KRF01990.1 hypothetical protein ASG87_10860 [Frateuria sp. Soil773]